MDTVYLLQYHRDELPEEHPFRAVLLHLAVSAARRHIAEANMIRSGDYPRLMRLEHDGTLTLVAGPSHLIEEAPLEPSA